MPPQPDAIPISCASQTVLVPAGLPGVAFGVHSQAGGTSMPANPEVVSCMQPNTPSIGLQQPVSALPQSSPPNLDPGLPLHAHVHAFVPAGFDPQDPTVAMQRSPTRALQPHCDAMLHVKIAPAIRDPNMGLQGTPQVHAQAGVLQAPKDPFASQDTVFQAFPEAIQGFPEGIFHTMRYGAVIEGVRCAEAAGIPIPADVPFEGPDGTLRGHAVCMTGCWNTRAPTSLVVTPEIVRAQVYLMCVRLRIFLCGDDDSCVVSRHLFCLSLCLQIGASIPVLSHVHVLRTDFAASMMTYMISTLNPTAVATVRLDSQIVLTITFIFLLSCLSLPVRPSFHTLNI
jgi:hypothetical protein